MKKSILLLLSVLLLFSGCTGKDFNLKHDIALSFDSERIAYDSTGKSTTALIFVHGWSCDSRYWQNQISAFSKDFRFITVDLAGHGHSSLNRKDYTVLSFAHDVKAVIEKENIKSAILIGHSMGGEVVAQAARLMPKKVIGIIGIDTLQNVGEKYPQSVIDNMIKPFEADFTNATKQFVSSMFPKGADPDLINWIREDMSSAPKRIALSAFRLYVQQYVTGEAPLVFKDINVPVVSVNGRQWPTAEEENRKYIKKYKLFYIENSGHFPMLEKPEDFNKILQKALDFIESESKR